VNYLIDTNVLSELRRREPDANVVRWMAQRPAATLFLSVLTLGELRKGVMGLPESERKHRLLDWLEVELPNYFAGRILPVDEAVAKRWGRLMSESSRPLPAIDSLLAATAMSHELTLVTRNVRDFGHPELAVVDPWVG
jgi:toxin FitB